MSRLHPSLSPWSRFQVYAWGGLWALLYGVVWGAGLAWAHAHPLPGIHLFAGLLVTGVAVFLILWSEWIGFTEHRVDEARNRRAEALKRAMRARDLPGMRRALYRSHLTWNHVLYVLPSWLADAPAEHALMVAQWALDEGAAPDALIAPNAAREFIVLPWNDSSQAKNQFSQPHCPLLSPVVLHPQLLALYLAHAPHASATLQALLPDAPGSLRQAWVTHWLATWRSSHQDQWLAGFRLDPAQALQALDQLLRHPLADEPILSTGSKPLTRIMDAPWSVSPATPAWERALCQGEFPWVLVEGLLERGWCPLAATVVLAEDLLGDGEECLVCAAEQRMPLEELIQVLRGVVAWRAAQTQDLLREALMEPTISTEGRRRL